MHPVPIVVLQYKAARGLEPLMERFATQLSEIVATVLNQEHSKFCHLQHVKPSDISVLVQQSGELDINIKDIEIIIWAHARSEQDVWYLYDRGNLAEKIANDFCKVLSDYDRNISGSIRILLQPIDFREF